MQTSKNNMEWINVLRLAALYAVIVLHVSSPLLAAYGKVSTTDWWTADIINAIVRFAVPVFVMITGAVLLHRDYEIGSFLKKRLGRVLLPFLFWSLVYIWYAWYNEDLIFTSNTWINIRMVLHLLKTGSSYHLWYVYMLIGLYFFLPILSKFVKNATDKELVYYLVVWLAVMMLSQPYFARFNPAVDMHYFFGFAGYLVLGHCLAYKKFNIKRLCMWAVLLFVLTAAAIAIGSRLVLNCPEWPGTMFYEPVSPLVTLLSASVFLLFRYWRYHVTGRAKAVINYVGNYGYGIYLAHALVLYFLEDPFNISYKLWFPVVSIPLTAFTCLLLSFLLVWAISKIPLGKYISG